MNSGPVGMALCIANQVRKQSPIQFSSIMLSIMCCFILPDPDIIDHFSQEPLIAHRTRFHDVCRDNVVSDVFAAKSEKEKRNANLSTLAHSAYS